MHLAILIVGQGILLQTLGHHLIGDDNLFGTTLSLYDKFQGVEQFARIASRETQQCIGLTYGDRLVLQIVVLADGAVEQFEQVVLVERLEYVELAAREQGTYDFKRRILRSSTESCCDLLKRCISSMKRMGLFCEKKRFFCALSMTSRTSFTPDDTALSV